ncbi:MAG: dihydropteroate synthase [Alphaproteobacteria bacterium]|jgi:5-methyltetrahydrofolate--homocysteine methyltransferase|nr:dihydropteroate synthase [Alphaproteobacteria bacterium]
MKLGGTNGGEFAIIGENIHTTRVLLRKGKRIDGEGAEEAILFGSEPGAAKRFPIPEDYKEAQEFQEGRVKHVKVALEAAMSGDAGRAALGMDYLRYLVERQESAGADFLDLNVDEISVRPEEQVAAMTWLVDAVQGMTRLPVSVDSSNPDVIRVGLEAADRERARPLLNSASLERIEALDMAVAHNAQVVVTAAGEKGMPEGAEDRMANATAMIEAAEAKGLARSDLHVDPLVFPVSVDHSYGLDVLETVRRLRHDYGPEIHITGGFSNVSFGIPGRKLINDVFLILAIEAGADSGIIDPVMTDMSQLDAMDRDSETYGLAEDLLMGRDEYCAKYLRAWRKGSLVGVPPPPARKSG